ncbi:MAG: fibronectin type III domain-containing protein, partial [Chloroflexi bacterium]|nr:fibronectin type III domain-containing protein [Chloroflexota bacterium]
MSIPCVQVPDELGDGLHNVYIWLRDRAGNSDHRTRHAVTLALDRIPPQLSAVVAGKLCGTAGWYNSPITVTFVATDTLSGMATGVISYQVNGGGWVQGNTYQESRDGRYVIEGRARDSAGNYSDIVLTSVKVDQTAPDAPMPIWVEPSDWSRENSFVVRWVNPWDLSGIAGVYYKQGSPPISPTDGVLVDGAQSSLTISATAEGVVPVYVWLVDKACNADHEKRAMVTLKYDRTPPTTTFTVDGILGREGWYTSSVQITLNCSDVHSGCGQGNTYYRIGSEPWRVGSSFMITSEGVITFSYYSVDIAGNVELTRTSSVKIDRTPPSSYAFTDRYSPSPSFTVRWDGSDAASGIASFDVQYKEGTAGAWQDWATSLDPSQRSKLFTGVRGMTYYFRTRARDRAGNVEAYPAIADTYVSVDPLLNGDFERDIAGEWEIRSSQGVCSPTRIYTRSYSGANTYAVVLGCLDEEKAP